MINRNDRIDIFDLWAKSSPYKSLVDHMTQSGDTAKILLQESIFSKTAEDIAYDLAIDQDEAINLVAYLTAVHDIGKCHPIFQIKGDGTKLQEWMLTHTEYQYPGMFDSYRHEIGSAKILKAIWEERDNFIDKNLISGFAAIVNLHHQGYRGKYYPLNSGCFEKGFEWLEWQRELEIIFYRKYRLPKLSKSRVVQFDAACMLITAIVILSDWISSSCFFDTISDEEEYIYRLRIFIQDSGLMEAKLPDAKYFSSLWKWIGKDDMRPLQRGLAEMVEAHSEKPLLMILEAPMGEGKTEAGIYGAIKMAEAWRKCGMYVALPTSATANQMIQRMNELLFRHNIHEARLIHGLAWIEMGKEKEEPSNNEAERWMTPSRLSLLFPYGVGTIDQILMSVIKVRFGVLRILGLSRKVIVIDEVHAYDAYMSTLLKRLLEWCKVLRIPVVLLSATLPVEKKKEYIDIYGEFDRLVTGYQQITLAYNDGNIIQKIIKECMQDKKIQLEVRPIADDIHAICECARKNICDGGCVCILVNTVKKAQKIYSALIKENQGGKVILFHSRFPVWKRKEIEQNCLSLFGKDKSKRPSNAILVATQVVEQSLDLDFDYIISEIAPIDLLLQRFGRLHRHSDTERPELLQSPRALVMIPEGDDYGTTSMVYYPLYLDRTRKCLEKNMMISVPQDIPLMVESVYNQSCLQCEEDGSYREIRNADQMKESMAENIELRNPKEKQFGLAKELQNMVDDDSSWVIAKTRLSTEIMRAALLPMELYAEANHYVSMGKYVPISLAAKVMQYVVDIPVSYLQEGFRSKDNSNRNYMYGTGKLSGIMLLEMRVVDEKEIEYCWISKNCIVVFENEIGVTIQKENEFEI